jgi:hypothetical protein
MTLVLWSFHNMLVIHWYHENLNVGTRLIFIFQQLVDTKFKPSIIIHTQNQSLFIIILYSF